MSATRDEAFRGLKNINKKQEIVLKAIAEEGMHGCTLFELCHKLNLPVNRVSGRVTELVDMYKVADYGARRRNPETGRNAVVWCSVGTA